MIERKVHQKRTNEYLHESEKETWIRSKKNDYEKLLQEVLNVYNALSRDIVQKKEETIGMNTCWDPKTWS